MRTHNHPSIRETLDSTLLFCQPPHTVPNLWSKRVSGIPTIPSSFLSPRRRKKERGEAFLSIVSAEVGQHLHFCAVGREYSPVTLVVTRRARRTSLAGSWGSNHKASCPVSRENGTGQPRSSNTASEFARGKKWWNQLLFQTSWGNWLARSEEYVALDLAVMSSSPTMGGEITK